jgi:hypothetical protein
MTLRDLTAGTVAAAVEISADEMPIGGRGIQPLGEGRMIDAMWQWAYLPSTVTLETGNAYALELSTADGSLYQVPAVRDGHDYYSPLLGYFDGYAEHATAEEPSEWVAWGSWGSVDDNMDIGFFFTAAD